MAVVHCVFLKLKPSADAELIMKELAGLQTLVPGLVSFSGGANSSAEGLSRGFSHGFTMIFDSAAARDAYLPHIEHERVKQLVIAAIEPDGVCVVDFPN
jgi:Stress responsive A/B Barrel Domain